MTAAARPDTRFRLGDDQARELAERFDTPLYVLDEACLRARARRFRDAIRAADSSAELAYGSKANSTLAVLSLLSSEGCWVDVASEGELRAALLAGVDSGKCIAHGSNKTRGEIENAIGAGVGQIVADHFGELEILGQLCGKTSESNKPDVLLRLAPGVNPKTHEKIRTGQSDTKFGFNIGDGSAGRATARCLELGLPLAGFHCHVGSQLLDSQAQEAGAEMLARFAIAAAETHGIRARVLNFGGGLGVRYADSDEPVSIEEWCSRVLSAARRALSGSGLSPTLFVEPGRALVAECGVTLYRVGAVKKVPLVDGGKRTYVSVDGGLSDNPRPALYGAPYAVLHISCGPGAEGRTSVPRTCTVSGKHCESDTLFSDVPLPSDVAAGDLLQVLSTGAYGNSMASNYNRYPRPATVLMRETGEPFLAQERERIESQFERERIPEEWRVNRD